MFTSSYLFDIVFRNSFQLTICRTKVGMLYKTELHHDRWGQFRADLQTEFQKAGMSILDDAKFYYVKNASVNSAII